jgi:hypothetical protein
MRSTQDRGSQVWVNQEYLPNIAKIRFLTQTVGFPLFTFHDYQRSHPPKTSRFHSHRVSLSSPIFYDYIANMETNMSSLIHTSVDPSISMSQRDTYNLRLPVSSSAVDTDTRSQLCAQSEEIFLFQYCKGPSAHPDGFHPRSPRGENRDEFPFIPERSSHVPFSKLWSVLRQDFSRPTPSLPLNSISRHLTVAWKSTLPEIRVLMSHVQAILETTRRTIDIVREHSPYPDFDETVT